MKKYPGMLFVILVAFCAAVQAQERPDFSGLWMPARAADSQGFPRDSWPYTELGQQLQDAFQADFDPVIDQPSTYCVQPGMPESMAQVAPFPIEIIQREQDITIFFEAWSQYRKIYIDVDGYNHPEPILNSRMGYSLGHWEGDTLVVEGSFLAERTRGRAIMTDQATFTERLSVEMLEDGTRRLRSEVIFTDPDIYTEPLTIVGYWRESPDTPILEYVCSSELYEQHLERVRGTR